MAALHLRNHRFALAANISGLVLATSTVVAVDLACRSRALALGREGANFSLLEANLLKQCAHVVSPRSRSGHLTCERVIIIRTVVL